MCFVSFRTHPEIWEFRGMGPFRAFGWRGSHSRVNFSGKWAVCSLSGLWNVLKAGYFYLIFIVCLPMYVDEFVCEQMCGCVHVYTDA